MTHPVKYTEMFHAAFEHPVRHEPVVPPKDERYLRVKLVLEEAIEFAEASGFKVSVREIEHNGETDIIAAADALADLNVVVNGSALVWGIPIMAVDRAVFESNMSKLGEDGQPIKREDGKILKGPNYFAPKIAEAIEAGLKAKQDEEKDWA